MKFAIITHAEHKIENNQFYGYGPYVREMRLWEKYVDELIILAPKSSAPVEAIDLSYFHKKIRFVEIPNFDITSKKSLIRSLFVIPIILFKIFRVMSKADHIHLRCPGNIGLLGCLVQILFPKKKKTAKYAGNWDPNAVGQSFTYKIQKKILSNIFLTKNIQTLVYGEWPNQTKNIKSFFTATYNKKEIVSIPERSLNNHIQLVFVGGLTEGKQPILSIKTAHELFKKGLKVKLDIYGDGIKRKELEEYIENFDLRDIVTLHGNVDKEKIMHAFQKAHFLIFISKSEGWPKVVAEAMFWGCVPLTSNVSCIEWMIGYGERGSIVSTKIEDVIIKIQSYIQDEKKYKKTSLLAKKWSQQYTLEFFEEKITKLI